MNRDDDIFLENKRKQYKIKFRKGLTFGRFRYTPENLKRYTKTQEGTQKITNGNLE